MRWGELTALGAKASARGAEVDILIDACHSGDAHLLQQLTVALSNYTDDIDPSWLDVLDRTSSYLLTARAETLQQLADAALRESAVS